jgi:hypothetical protein
MFIVLGAIALVLPGCGESSSAGSGPSVEFMGPHGKNKKFAAFGEEADVEEREAASRVLEESFKARQGGDWKTQCATLSAKAVKENKEFAEIQGVAGGSCAKDLQGRAEPLQISKQVRVNTLTGPIDALRVKGDRGYVLYHGKGGGDYEMPMEKEDGEWKVGDVVEEPLATKKQKEQ